MRELCPSLLASHCASAVLESLRDAQGALLREVSGIVRRAIDGYSEARNSSCFWPYTAFRSRQSKVTEASNVRSRSILCSVTCSLKIEEESGVFVSSEGEHYCNKHLRLLSPITRMCFLNTHATVKHAVDDSSLDRLFASKSLATRRFGDHPDFNSLCRSSCSTGARQP